MTLRWLGQSHPEQQPARKAAGGGGPPHTPRLSHGTMGLGSSHCPSEETHAQLGHRPASAISRPTLSSSSS